jgi:hypothetical protein
MIECLGPRLTLKLQKWVHLAKQEFAQRWCREPFNRENPTATISAAYAKGHFI